MEGVRALVRMRTWVAAKGHVARTRKEAGAQATGTDTQRKTLAACALACARLGRHSGMECSYEAECLSYVHVVA